MAFHSLEKLNALHDGYQKAFSVAGHSLLLVQIQGQVYLIENQCPHMDVPLTNAVLLKEGGLRCQAHGIEFSLATGKASGPLADTLSCLKKYPLVYREYHVGVDFDA